MRISFKHMFRHFLRKGVGGVVDLNVNIKFCTFILLLDIYSPVGTPGV